MFRIASLTPPQSPVSRPLSDGQGLSLPMPFAQSPLKRRKVEDKTSKTAQRLFENSPSKSSSLSPRVPLRTSSSSASSASSLSAMPSSFLIAPQFFSRGQSMQIERKTAPPAPVKRRTTSSVTTHNGYTLTHFTVPSVIRDYHLTKLAEDGKAQYKTAWRVPTESPPLVDGKSNNEILVLTFKENVKNYNARSTYEHMDSSIKQYREVLQNFGQDRCVTIYNTNTAIEDGYFVVEKIERSLEDVLKELTGEFRSFERIEQLNQSLNESQQKAISILGQIKGFYDLSIQYGIDTDIHAGNFRVKVVDGNYRIILTDFRESIEEGDLVVNKRTELRDLKKALSGLFSEEFIDEFFADTIRSFGVKQAEEEIDDDELVFQM